MFLTYISVLTYSVSSLIIYKLKKSLFIQMQLRIYITNIKMFLVVYPFQIEAV